MTIEETKAPINQSVVGHVPADQAAQVETAAAAATSSQDPAPASDSAAPADPAPAPADPAAPAAPAESTGEKVATGIEIGLTDVSAIAKVVSGNFAGTPVAAIAALLGPIAGLGAAVLAQHLTHRGFDLSTLKDAPVI